MFPLLSLPIRAEISIAHGLQPCVWSNGEPASLFSDRQGCSGATGRTFDSKDAPPIDSDGSRG